MSKISNKGQLNSKYNRVGDLKQNNAIVKRRNTIDWYEVEQECNKPLQSKFAVQAYGKLRSEWYSHNDMNKRLKTHHFGSTWYEVDRNENSFHEVGSIEILKEQQRLYNKLKREYEKAQNDMVTTVEKVKAKVRNRNVKLLSGLTCSPNYDRIYKEV